MVLQYIALALLFVVVIMLSRIISIGNGIREAVEKMTALPQAAAVAAPVAVATASAAIAPVAAPQMDIPASGEIVLVGVDEKTAALAMAIVADQTDIPLGQLRFTSIKKTG